MNKNMSMKVAENVTDGTPMSRLKYSPDIYLDLSVPSYSI